MQKAQSQFSRREREIMDILYRLGRASAEEVRRAMASPPSYSAVRAMLRILEEKGQLRHRQDGRRYVFFPAVPPEKAKRSALRHLLQTFFSGSIEKAVASLLELEESSITENEIDQLSKLIEQTKKKKN